MTYMLKVGNYSSMYLPVQTMEENEQCFLASLKEPQMEACVNVVGSKVIGHESEVKIIQEYLDQTHTRKARQYLNDTGQDKEWLVRVMDMQFLSWLQFNQHIGRGNDVMNYSPLQVRLSVDPDNYRSIEFVVMVNDRAHHIYVDLKDRSISGERDWCSLIPIYFYNPQKEENQALEGALMIKDADRAVMESARVAWGMQMSDNARHN